jgi:putative flippase GtrA
MSPLGRRFGILHSGFVGQLVRFGIVGVFSTALYTGLFVALRLWFPAQAANALALLLSALANTLLNRRFTFFIRGPRRRNTHVAQGLVVFGLALGLTGGSLAALHALFESPNRSAEVVVLTTANVVSTCMRFLLLRLWVFRHGPDRAQPAAATAPAPGAGGQDAATS